MPKIDESKIADILNTLLTDNILKGENLIQNLDKSVSNLSKTAKTLDGNVAARSEEIKELAKILANAPKLCKAIKISAILASFAVGVAVAALLFLYPIGSITYKFIQAREAYSELVIKYDEISKQASKLNTELKAHIKVYDRLDSNSKQALVNILIEERQKIQQEKESK